MKRLAISMMMFCSVMAVSAAAWCGDNGNGTVTLGSLVVLKDAGCLDSMKWNSAMARAKTVADGQCGLTDKSKAGDWRLPTIDELLIMYSNKSQFKNVKNVLGGFYWSSSTHTVYTNHAFVVDTVFGTKSHEDKFLVDYVWPVRGGL
jgi:hypothetical protein